MQSIRTMLWIGSALALSIAGCSSTDEGERTETGGRPPPGRNLNPPTPQAGNDQADPPSSPGNFGNPMEVSNAQPAQIVDTEELAGLDEDTCARADVVVERVRPRVVFLVDSSSSMIEDFGGPTRWDALRDSLLAEDGVVPKLEALVKFGLITYAGPRFTACPSYRYAAPAPSNLVYVDNAFPEAPPEESSTPTGAAMDWAIDNAFIEQVAGPDQEWEPQYMIFATDGEPNGCAQGSTGEPERDFDSVIAAAHKAASRGISIFVLSLAEASGEFADHLAEVAKIGGTDTVYSPQSKADLVEKMLEIVGAAISCEVKLQGKIYEDMACQGTVWLNNEELECGGDDGWELSDPSHILFKNKACEDFRFTPSAHARAEFPCAAIQ